MVLPLMMVGATSDEMVCPSTMMDGRCLCGLGIEPCLRAEGGANGDGQCDYEFLMDNFVMFTPFH